MGDGSPVMQARRIFGKFFFFFFFRFSKLNRMGADGFVLVLSLLFQGGDGNFLKGCPAPSFVGRKSRSF